MEEHVLVGGVGDIIDIFVEEGDYVDIGQVIAKLDDGNAVTSTASGTVIEILVDEGDFVCPEDIILTVNTED